MAMDSELSAFSAWSLLSLTATAHGLLAYPDELGVRYVYDNTVPNGRYVTVGDLAVIRDNRYVLGAGWIDSIEESDASKIRYRCPNCGSTDFKYRSTQQFAYRCARCGTEFNDNDRREEELTVQVFTANYSRTFRLADPPFPVKVLDPAYTARSQQNAIRRLDPAALRPMLEKNLVTGEPWWEGSRAGTSTSGRRYWTLAAHPGRYQVVDAIRNLDEDWWTTGGADLHAGDRVAIWKYKGPEERRGIVAFGEVLTDPEMHDDDSPYWIDLDAKAPALRVRVRYVIKPPEPLWLELAPAESVIRQLPVSRAQGGTAHHVTADQWTQLMTLVGGWPRPGARQDDGASGWPGTEIRPTVTAYFTMLRAELAGQPYVKADFNREVQAATGRSRGAVDYKFENISAVLREIGLPYVLGYKPYGNYQGALRDEVELLLARDPEIARLLEEGPAPDVPPTVQLVEVEPPVMPPPSTTGRSRTTVGVDYLERQARNRGVGLKGEHLVVEHEREWLSAHGRPDLAELVVHVPSTLGDGAGYDVSSFLLDGSSHHIEVKTTRGSVAAPFFLSDRERCYALEHPGTYSIYRIFDLGPNPGFYKLTGDIAEILDLTPVSYQARVKAPGAHSAVQASLPWIL
jgi:DNA-directed RNA polymerase subunit RPC12/RpoP